MAKAPKKQREPTREEKRAAFNESVKAAYTKLKSGETLTSREARILKKSHDAFLELYDIFKPSIISVLRDQSRKIDSMLEEAEIEEEEEE